MNRRRQRQDQLFKWSVIIACVLTAFMCMSILIVAYQRQMSPPPAPKPEAVSMSLPEKCSPLYNVDKHREWATCMGVAYR